MLPPIVKSPDTSKFPVMFTSSLKFTLPDASIIKSPDKDSTMFELNFTFPVCIFEPSMFVVPVSYTNKTLPTIYSV